MKMEATYSWLCMALLLGSLVPHSMGCIYEMTIMTGCEPDAGIDAKVYMRAAPSFSAYDLKKYGAEEAGHKYFATGARDHFKINRGDSAINPCVTPCEVEVWHDNTDDAAGWKLDFVILDAYNVSGGQHMFTKVYEFNKWVTNESVRTDNECLGSRLRAVA